jgi:hypothetical protein
MKNGTDVFISHSSKDESKKLFTLTKWTFAIVVTVIAILAWVGKQQV